MICDDTTGPLTFSELTEPSLIMKAENEESFMLYRVIRGVGALVVVVTISACAQPARTGAMVASVSDATVLNADNPLKNAVGMGGVSGGQETSPLWTSEVSDQDFKKALELSLKQHTILGSGDAPLKLTTTLVNLDQPFGGFTMTVVSSVRYVIKTTGGSTVFDETVAASGTATFSDAGLGVERLRLANERSIKANIQDFINRLVEQSKNNPSSFGDTATSGLLLKIG